MHFLLEYQHCRRGGFLKIHSQHPRNHHLQHIVWLVASAHDTLELMWLQCANKILMDRVPYSQVVFQAIWVRLDMAYHTFHLTRVRWAPNPCQRLPCEVPGADDAQPPQAPRLIEPPECGIDTEHEEDRERRRAQREWEGGDTQERHQLWELAFGHPIVEGGHKHGVERAKYNDRRSDNDEVGAR